MLKKVLAVICAATMMTVAVPQVMAEEMVYIPHSYTDNFSGYDEETAIWGKANKVTGFKDVAEEITVAENEEGNWILSQVHRGQVSDYPDWPAYTYVTENGIMVGNGNEDQEYASSNVITSVNFMPKYGAAKTVHAEAVRRRGNYGGRGAGIKFLISADEQSWYGIEMAGALNESNWLPEGFEKVTNNDLLVIKSVNGVKSVIASMIAGEDGAYKNEMNSSDTDRIGKQGDFGLTSIFKADVNAASKSFTAYVGTNYFTSWNPPIYKNQWTVTINDPDFDYIFAKATIPMAVSNRYGAEQFDDINLSYNCPVTAKIETATYTEDFEGYDTENSAFGFSNMVTGFKNVVEELVVAQNSKGTWKMSQEYRGQASSLEGSRAGAYITDSSTYTNAQSSNFRSALALGLAAANSTAYTWTRPVAVNFVPNVEGAKTQHIQAMRRSPNNFQLQCKGNRRTGVRFLVSKDEKSWYGLELIPEKSDAQVRIGDFCGDWAIVKCVDGVQTVIASLINQESGTFQNRWDSKGRADAVSDGQQDIFVIDVDKEAGGFTTTVKHGVLENNLNYKYEWTVNITDDPDFAAIYEAAAIPMAVSSYFGMEFYDDINLTYNYAFVDEPVEYVTDAEYMDGLGWYIEISEDVAEDGKAYVAYFNGDSLVYLDSRDITAGEAFADFFEDTEIGEYTSCKLMVWNDEMQSLIGPAYTLK